MEDYKNIDFNTFGAHNDIDWQRELEARLQDTSTINPMEADASIRGYFASAQAQRRTLETSADSTSSTYQENLQVAIASLEECRHLANRISLFSPNETEDDISTTDLQYF